MAKSSEPKFWVSAHARARDSVPHQHIMWTIRNTKCGPSVATTLALQLML
jgi:hypothetical protein